MINQNPLFVVGHPRSGTTLLSLIISSHDSISLRNNDDILMAFFSAGLGLKSQINENAFDKLISMSDRLEDFDLFIGSLCKKKISKIKSILPTDGWTIFHSLLSNDNNRILWGNKSHSYLWFYKSIIENYKGSKFIIIIRDPRAVVVSNYMKYIARFKFNKTNTNDIAPDLIKFHDARNYFIQTSHRWMAWHYKLIEIQKIIPDSYMKIIRYEDLISAPQKTLKTIFSKINVKYSDDIINSELRMENEIIKDPLKSYAHMNTSKPINKSINKKWKKVDKNLISIVEHICKKVMINYGYDPAVSHNTLKSLYLNQYLDYRYNYQTSEINFINSIIKFDNDYC